MVIYISGGGGSHLSILYHHPVITWTCVRVLQAHNNNNNNNITHQQHMHTQHTHTHTNMRIRTHTHTHAHTTHMRTQTTHMSTHTHQHTYNTHAHTPKQTNKQTNKQGKLIEAILDGKGSKHCSHDMTTSMVKGHLPCCGLLGYSLVSFPFKRLIQPIQLCKKTLFFCLFKYKCITIPFCFHPPPSVS